MILSTSVYLIYFEHTGSHIGLLFLRLRPMW